MTISRQDIDATIELLCERFPRAFFRFERWRVPLKLRIRDDLIAALGDTIDPELIGLALKGYTRNLAYRRSQLQGSSRIDLVGQPAGTVLEADARSAAKHVILRIPALRERQSLAKTQAKASPAPAPETPAPPPPPPPRKDGLTRSVKRQSGGGKQRPTIKTALMRLARARNRLPGEPDTLNRETGWPCSHGSNIGSK